MTAILARQVRKALRVIPAPKAQQARKVPREKRVIPAIQAPRVMTVHRASQAPREEQAHRVLLDLKGLKAQKVIQEKLAPLAHKALRVIPAHKARLAHKAQRVQLGAELAVDSRQLITSTKGTKKSIFLALTGQLACATVQSRTILQSLKRF